MSVVRSTIEHMFEDEESSGPCAGGSPGDRSEVSRPMRELESWLDAPPAAEMFAALEQVDPAGLDARDAITYLEVLDRFTCWLQSRQSLALVAAAGDSPTVTTSKPVRGSVTVNLADVIREEVGSALRLAPGTAQTRINRARLLVGSLARTGEALAAAEISYGHAAAIADVADRLSVAGAIDQEGRAAFEQACLALEDRVLPIARRGTIGQAKAAAERALLALDAEAVKEQRKRQRSAADVQVFDDAAGMSTLWARLTTEMAHACLASINACAASPDLMAPEGSNIGARRAFALTALITGVRPTPAPGDSGADGPGDSDSRSVDGSSPMTMAVPMSMPMTTPVPMPVPLPLRASLGVHLDVTISAAALVGLSQEPAEITAAGSTVPVLVPAHAIRELAALECVDRLTWRRLVVDPKTGHLLDRGRDSCQVGKRMRDWIVTRDRTCRFPGCMRRAAKCEIDHAQPWDAGGRTVRGNLGALCKRHHLMKTHAGWSIEVSADDGSCIWVSPMGHRYPHEVESLLPELPQGTDLHQGERREWDPLDPEPPGLDLLDPDDSDEGWEREAGDDRLGPAP